jgi:lysophospholipase L1-like esterase
VSWQQVERERVGAGARRNRNIVFFGDSICVGQGVSIHKGWVTRIAARISDISASRSAELVVINASVNGNTTRQALERMPYDVQSHGVAILIVQFGMNDCNYWLTDRGLPRVSGRVFAANLHEMIARGFRFGAERVFINTNHPTTRVYEKLPLADVTYEASNAQYNQIVRDVAAEWDARVVLNDVERSFLQNIGEDRSRLAGYLLSDGLHLSERGHDLYFDLIAPVIERAVVELIDAGVASIGDYGGVG